MMLNKKKTETPNLITTLKQNLGQDGNAALFVEGVLDRDSLFDLGKRPLDEVVSVIQVLWERFKNRRYEDIVIDVKEDNFAQIGRIDITIIQRQIPFITDSILNLLRQNHLSVNVMINATMKLRRDDDGVLLSIHDSNDHGPDLQADKILYIQCENRGDVLDMAQLQQSISDILRDVHAAVEDWRSMQGQISDTIDDLEQPSKTIQQKDALEAAHFLDFLKDGNFTFLGYREHAVRHEKNGLRYETERDKSLGILRDDSFLVFDRLTPDEKIPETVRTILESPEPVLMVLKANRVATVHRNVHMDVVLIKKYNAKGEVIALRLFSGLFTAQCYAKPTEQIPYLKQKVETILQRAGYEEDTHAWRALRHILDSYPRDELFQIEPETLYQHALGISRLNNRPEVDVFVRRDRLQRHFSALIYLPKEQYDTTLRLKVQHILEQELHGHVVAHYLSVDEKPLARLQYTIAGDTAELKHFDLPRIRARLIEVCTPWSERLKIAALQKFGKQEAQSLLLGLGGAFSVAYQDEVSIPNVLNDLERLQHVVAGKKMVVALTRQQGDPDSEYRIKLYKPDEEARLSELLPMLDRMGFHCLHEYSYEFHLEDGAKKIWMHDLVGTLDFLDKDHIAEIQPLFAEAFENIWNGRVESDSFNTLIFAAALTWREANIFRALARYLDLAGYPLGKRYIGQVLADYPQITQHLRDTFMLRHNPQQDAGQTESLVVAHLTDIGKLLESIEKIDDDRVMRSMMTLINEIVRTNYFHRDSAGQPLDLLVMKFNAQNLKDLPQPRPYREIFIYGKRVEAVHLRGGPIARGGIRWSDRYEDFRTEILGLVKAQIVKNAVIVPVGSKGGFICKNQPAMTPDERKKEGIACYQIMIRGMLSITDNLVDGKIIPPANTVRLDGDDPYLVVAADKGTATFSDTANAISLEHSFWLGDAFASGGSQGYDHKAIGITARGAWECIKRHFREMDKDIQTENFTVIGVGDMSGDVFGNGMLMSEQTKLLAAFDHRHIFIDPDPDAKKSMAERKRMFALPTSSWADYNAKLISKGGAIYSRQEKSVTLTPEIKKWLKLTIDRISPNELIHEILRAEAELLYFGGIGTYIKASSQSHEQVGDKANDTVRINAREIQCKVIGEGANLAMTQAARIEYAQHGGRLNTDFIDNSAGVDTSDHEVNIKILLNPLVRNGRITEDQRNQILIQMTNDVAAHVLKNNYDQSLALSLTEQRAVEEAGLHAQFIRQLERQNLMDRRLEGLPDDDSFQRLMQRHAGLTRPELAILLAYSKITLFNALMKTSMADDPALQYQLFEYFPDLLQEKFKDDIPNHILKKDIITTEVVNVLVNRMGPIFVANEVLQGGAPADAVTKAWLLVRATFDLKTLWSQIDALDNKVPVTQQLEAYDRIAEVMHEGVAWFLQHYGNNLDLQKLVPQYSDGLTQLQSVFAELFPVEEAQGDALQMRLAQLSMLLAGCDIVYLHQKTGAPTVDVAKTYFALSERLKITLLRSALDKLAIETVWEQEVVDNLETELRSLLAELTQQALAAKIEPQAIEVFLTQREAALQAADFVLADAEHMAAPDLSLLTVVAQRMRRLTYAGGNNHG